MAEQKQTLVTNTDGKCSTLTQDQLFTDPSRMTDSYIFILTFYVFPIAFMVHTHPSWFPDFNGWMQPEGWTGPDPVLYWSFNNLDGLVLMAGTQQKKYDALTDGKVGQSNHRTILKFPFNKTHCAVLTLGTIKF